MTKEELAKILDGREYGSEITKAEVQIAKENGLVVVYGYSDDNCEFEGAINDEIPCYEGAIITFSKDGDLFFDKIKPSTPNMIEMEWCPIEPNCSWLVKTDIPHASFDIYEDGDIFCRGLVFNVSDLK